MVLFALHTPSSAQYYSVSTSTGSYTDLVDPISLNNGFTWDDPISLVIPLGFDFDFMGVTTNEFILDGGLGGTLVIDNGEDMIPVLTATAHDLVDRAAGADIIELQPNSLSPISYKLTGEPGSQILKLEWKNVGFYSDLDQNEGLSTDYMNLQLWLYEGSNEIEIHHGPKSLENQEISFEGAPGDFLLFSPAVDLSENIVGPESMFVHGDPDNLEITVFDEQTALTIPPFVNGPIPENSIIRLSPNTSVSIQQADLSAEMLLSPNPATDRFSIVADPEVLESNTAQIYSALGQLVQSCPANQSIEIKQFERGVYFVQVGSTVRKLIVK